MNTIFDPHQKSFIEEMYHKTHFSADEFRLPNNYFLMYLFYWIDKTDFSKSKPLINKGVTSQKGGVQ